MSYDSIKLVGYNANYNLKTQNPEIDQLFENNIIKYQVKDVKEKENKNIMVVYENSVTKEIE